MVSPKKKIARKALRVLDAKVIGPTGFRTTSYHVQWQDLETDQVSTSWTKIARGTKRRKNSPIPRSYWAFIQLEETEFMKRFPEASRKDDRVKDDSVQVKIEYCETGGMVHQDLSGENGIDENHNETDGLMKDDDNSDSASSAAEELNTPPQIRIRYEEAKPFEPEGEKTLQMSPSIPHEQASVSPLSDLAGDETIQERKVPEVAERPEEPENLKKGPMDRKKPEDSDKPEVFQYPSDSLPALRDAQRMDAINAAASFNPTSTIFGQGDLNQPSSNRGSRFYSKRRQSGRRGPFLYFSIQRTLSPFQSSIRKIWNPFFQEPVPAPSSFRNAVNEAAAKIPEDLSRNLTEASGPVAFPMNNIPTGAVRDERVLIHPGGDERMNGTAPIGDAVHPMMAFARVAQNHREEEPRELRGPEQERAMIETTRRDPELDECVRRQAHIFALMAQMPVDTSMPPAGLPRPTPVYNQITFPWFNPHSPHQG